MARNKQVAALPWRRGGAGVEILLVTTRTTKRWVIPKGWPMAGKADYDAAAVEAFEEAGVKGLVSREPYGHYGYLKTSDRGKARHVDVTVYLLHVQQELDTWPEREERERRWMRPEAAIDQAGEGGLVPLLKQFAEHPPQSVPDTRVEEKSPWSWLIDLFR
jgi:8-oxo-dGTP pyrophosphatase MutT (NUDIX family)